MVMAMMMMGDGPGPILARLYIITRMVCAFLRKHRATGEKMITRYGNVMRVCVSMNLSLSLSARRGVICCVVLVIRAVFAISPPNRIRWLEYLQ